MTTIRHLINLVESASTDSTEAAQPLRETIAVANTRKQLVAFLTGFMTQFSRTIDQQQLTGEQATRLMARDLTARLANSGMDIDFQVGQDTEAARRVAVGGVNRQTGRVRISLDPTKILSGHFSLKENLTGYVHLLASCILHELLHGQQRINSGGKAVGHYAVAPGQKVNPIEYLSDKIEIQAKAKDAVEELMLPGKIPEGISLAEFIRTNYQGALDISDVMHDYWGYFGQHKDNPGYQRIWNRFLKTMVFYAEDADREA